MQPQDRKLIVFGMGYTGRAIAAEAAQAGWHVTRVSREPQVGEVRFDSVEAALDDASHLVATAAPGEAGDPVLARWGDRLGGLSWAGYLSSTGVYGDRDGAWVDEDTAPAPAPGRGQRRLEAELAWRVAMAGRALDLFRLAGIYGPGRSVLDDVRAGTARRIAAPGHAFGRIHRDDIAAGVLAAMSQPGPRARVLNFADDEPAESADVIAEAARLLRRPLPPLVPLADARPGMSAMARSFWADRRRVRSARTQEALGLHWRYPTYREGLRGILEHEIERANEPREVGRA